MTTLKPIEPENIRSDSIISAYSLAECQTKDGEKMLLEKEFTNLNVGKFSMRPARMTDLPDAVDLFERCSRYVIGFSDVNPDDVKNEWQLPKFNLEESVRVVHDRNGRLVGYVEVWDIDAVPVSIWVWLRVHPNYHGHGIGSMLLEWAENKARKAIPRVPDDVQVVMEAGTYHIFQRGHDRLIQHEMKPVRQFLTMSIELDKAVPRPHWPAGISVRTMLGEEEPEPIIRAVYDAFQDHWGFVQQPFEDSYERWTHFIRESEDFDPDLWFLAMDGDEIAGVSLCWPKANEDSEMGWVGTLGVRRPWRNQGLGLALLQHSFEVFAQRGKKRVGLGVDGQSLTGATRLYERAGMSPISNWQFDLYQKVLRPGRDISKQEI